LALAARSCRTNAVLPATKAVGLSTNFLRPLRSILAG
jgi:hypothetical protein